MKIFYKLHIMSTAPLTTEEIELMNLPKEFSERLVFDENNSQIASIIVSSDDSGNPELDEISILLDIIDDYGNADIFFGYPKKDMSNAVNAESEPNIWELLDECEVDFN